MDGETVGLRTERAVDSFKQICSALGLQQVASSAEDAGAPAFLPPTPGTSAAAKVTGFGSAAAAERRSTFVSAIISVRAALQRQQQLTERSQKDAATKDQARQLLVAHGDRLAVEAKVETSEAMLVRLADKMQHALTGKGATNTGQKFRAIARAAKQLGMTVDKDENDVFLSHPTFFVEINFDAADDDVVKDLKITHNRSGDHEEKDPAILAALQNDRMADFLCGMRRIYELHGPDEEEADGREEPTKFSALCTLESDMLAIHAAEKQRSPELSLADLVLRGHGLMRPRLGGQMFSLAYFGIPLTLKAAAAAIAGSTAGKDGDLPAEAWEAAPRTLTLGVATLEENCANRVALSGKQRYIGPLKMNGSVGIGAFDFDRSEETSPTPPPCIGLLQLDQPVATSIFTARQLSRIASGGSVDEGSLRLAQQTATLDEKQSGLGATGAAGDAAKWNHLPSVQTLVVGRNPPTTNVAGCTYRFADEQQGKATVCKGVWLSTAQLGRAEHLHSILQLLRQQQTFNALLLSCIEEEDDTERFSSCTIEVSSTAPTLIQLNTFHAELNGMLCITITVGLGGTIVCSGSSSAKSPLGDGGGAFERLAERLSIPLMVREYLAEQGHTLKRAPSAADESNAKSSRGGARSKRNK